MALPVYGLDADLKAKRDAQYDPKLEAEARGWVEHVTGERLNGSLHDGLKSGVVLCKLVNKIKPGKIGKIGTGNMPFIQMENISSYLNACASLGMATHDLFQTVDLYEAKNMNQVINNLIAFKRISGAGNQSFASSASQSSGSSEGSKFCSNCGTKLPSSAKFCPNCGSNQ